MERYCSTCGRRADKKADNVFVCELGHEDWINPIIGAVVYVVKDGKVLFGTRSIEPNAGKLSLPGGFINIGETAEQAAVRETKEEMGIDISIRSYLGTYTMMYGDRPVLDIVFIADCISETVTPGDDLIGGEPVWRPINDLPQPNELAWDWYQAPQKDLLEWWQSQD